MGSEAIVDYDYVKNSIGDKTKQLIDVREPDELTKHGVIPQSLNIPLGNINTALSMPDDEFKKNFGINKPGKDKELIFFCMMGRRAAKAQEEAIALGFNNTKNYLGSYTDWKSKSQ